MDSFMEKLIGKLEPTISDLDEVLKDLDIKKEELDIISDMLDYINNDIKKFSQYTNQNIIMDYLGKIDSDEKEYNANCYLLESDREEVKNLPQYNKAKEFFNKLLTYFKARKDELSVEVEELTNIVDEKKLNKKYILIFKEEKPLVDDVDEFDAFIRKQEIDTEDKIMIMKQIIKNNVDSYEKGR